MSCYKLGALTLEIYLLRDWAYSYRWVSRLVFWRIGRGRIDTYPRLVTSNL